MWEDKHEGWIYLGDDKARYILGEPGKRNILVFGINPSTACPGEENIDPTIRKIRKLIMEDGFDGWIMVNLYPLRETDPKKLPRRADEKLIKKNINILKTLVSSYYVDRIWAAWGDAIDTRSYLGDTLYDIQEELVGDFLWYYRGQMTKAGNPRHPLYMKSGEPYVSFPVADYASNWRY
jgi:hypothetical protein